MNAFLYGVALQWKLDIRSRTLLVTCYIVPLLFFAVMGGIFTSLMPESKATLVQSMTVMGVSMGALVGLPPSLVEIYGSDIKKAYKANGVSIYLGLVSMFISAFIHLMIMSTIIYLAASVAFQAVLPEHLPSYLGLLAVFTAVSLIVGCVLGLLVNNQAKLTMLSQLLFLPSIMLSGIMFPASLLPKPLQIAGKLFPAYWGYRMMTGEGSVWENLLYMLFIFLGAVLMCVLLLKRRQAE